MLDGRSPSGADPKPRVNNGGRLVTRLLSVREAARLMGAPDSYLIPGTYNEGYGAMGDAVAVPVVRFLAQHLLWPLAQNLSNGSHSSNSMITRSGALPTELVDSAV